jgi:hypothetical protein
MIPHAGGDHAQPPGLSDCLEGAGSCCPGDLGSPTQDGTGAQPAGAWPDEPTAAASPGFKQSKFRPQGKEGAAEKLDGFCSVIEEVLALAGRDLDRLILARELMSRVTAKTRSCRSWCPAGDGAACGQAVQGHTQGGRSDAGAAWRRSPRELTGRTRYCA